LKLWAKSQLIMPFWEVYSVDMKKIMG